MNPASMPASSAVPYIRAPAIAATLPELIVSRSIRADSLVVMRYAAATIGGVVINGRTRDTLRLRLRLMSSNMVGTPCERVGTQSVRVARWNEARSSVSSIPEARCASSAGASARENGRSPHTLRTASLTNTLAIGPMLAASALAHADRNRARAGWGAPTAEAPTDQ